MFYKHGWGFKLTLALGKDTIIISQFPQEEGEEGVIVSLTDIDLLCEKLKEIKNSLKE